MNETSNAVRPLRILQAINQLSRQGAEKFVVQLSRALSRQPDLEVKILITENTNDFAEELRAADVEVVYIPAQTGPLRTTNIAQLESFLQDFRPDVIHSHILPVDALFTACTYRAQHYLFHIHSSRYTGYVNPRFRLKQWRENLGDYLLKRKVLQLSRQVHTQFITVSAYDRQEVQHYLPASAQLAYLRNGIELPESIVEQETASDSRILISVGRLDENKNQLFQLKVLRKLVRQDPRFSLVLLGTGPELETLEAYVHTHQLSAYIHFSGSVPDVYTALQHASLFLHTARSEALSLAIMEAIACGLPVVMLNGNGNAELAASAGVAMIDAENETLFADRILEIFGNESLFTQMQRDNLQFATGFSMDAYVLQWRQLLESGSAVSGIFD